MDMESPHHDRESARQAIRKARRITSMVQGTMGLEGQGLDERTLKEMTRKTARELLLKPRT